MSKYVFMTISPAGYSTRRDKRMACLEPAAMPLHILLGGMSCLKPEPKKAELL